MIYEQKHLILAGAAVVAALGIGFTAAKLTASPSATPTATKAEPEEEHAESEGLEMAAARIATSGIQVAPVKLGGFSAEILAQATVEATPQGQAVLTARAAGSVARINKRLGDAVRAGEVVGLVESREAASIAADRSVAAAKAALARKVLGRERRLYEAKVTPRQDLETAQAELAAAEAEQRRASVAAGAADVSADGRYVQVISPISGRITAAPASLGAFVAPETELFRVANPERIQIEAAVTAADARRIVAGDPVVVDAPAGGVITAVVRSVTPSVNEETRSATVVLSITSGAGLLQPGQLVKARILPRSGGGTSQIVVPDDAVQSVEGKDVVFIRTTTGFRAQPVTVGRRSGDRAEITEGLKAGQMIATRNAFFLKAELAKAEAEH